VVCTAWPKVVHPNLQPTAGTGRRVVQGGPERSSSSKGVCGPSGPPGPFQFILIHSFWNFTESVDQGGSGWTRTGFYILLMNQIAFACPIIIWFAHLGHAISLRSKWCELLSDEHTIFKRFPKFLALILSFSIFTKLFDFPVLPILYFKSELTKMANNIWLVLNYIPRYIPWVVGNE